MRGTGHGVIKTALILGAGTVIVVLPSRLGFAYRQPSLHVALEMAESLIALLATLLVFARLRRGACLDGLALAAALGVLVLVNVLFITLPSLVEPLPHDLTVSATLSGRSLGASLLAVAAFAPLRRPRWPSLTAVAGAAGATIAPLMAATAVSVFTWYLLQTFAAAAPLGWWPRLPVQPHSALRAAQIAAAVMYGVAAAGFARRAQRLGHAFDNWLATGAVFAAGAQVNYSLYPPPYIEWVKIGDAFYLFCYAVILAGSTHEIWSYWRTQSEAAVLEERQRIACDLHDGLAQELAYLARNLDSLRGEVDQHTLCRLRWATERAQREARRAVNALATPVRQAVDIAVAQTAAEVAQRFDVGLDLALVPGIRLPPARAEALTRIAREAVTNAARHSGANRVSLGMECAGSRVRLWVSDSGRGFDTTLPGDGFGLISMRERASSVGGELRISSSPGRGSQVEAAL